MVSERVSALLAEAPGLAGGLERASQLDGPRLPVLDAFETLLPDRGLRPGTSTQVCGTGATTLALALIAPATRDAWTAVVGMPALGLCAASELGVDLDHLVVIPDPGKRWTDVMGAVIDAFDVVVARPQLSGREARRVAGRVRERDAVLITVGPWADSDVRIATTSPPTWEGIEPGHGHLAARRVTVNVSGRRGAALGRTATLWLPDHDGEVRIAEPSNNASGDGMNVVRLAAR